MRISVTTNSVEISQRSTVNEGEYKANKCEFEFTAPFDGLVKKAVFVGEDKRAFEMVIDSNNECDIPEDILKAKGTCKIGVYAYDVDGETLVKRYSPEPASFKVDAGSYRENVENPSDVTPSQAEQLEASVNHAVAQMNATQREVQEALDSGALKGEKGDKGDTGEKGDTGNRGPQGERGEKGDTGAKGDTGEKGDTGDQGPQGIQGVQGPAGKDFSIAHTYASISAMKADSANVEEGEFVIIASTTEDPDNAKLFVRTDSSDPDEAFSFLTDMSGAQGVKGDKGEQGIQGEQGIPGNDGNDGEDGTDGTDGYSPQVTLTQLTSTTARITIESKDASTGQITTQTADFGGTFADGNGVSY